jgi:hypothetical protein
MRSYARRTMSLRIAQSIESRVPITAIGSTANARDAARDPPPRAPGLPRDTRTRRMSEADGIF